MAEALPQSAVECPICYIPFDGRNCKPTVGLCGHSVCWTCFQYINGKCPICNALNVFMGIVIDYSLIEQIEMTQASLARNRTELGQREEEIDVLKVELSEKNESLQKLEEENEKLKQQRGPCECAREPREPAEVDNNELQALKISLAGAELNNDDLRKQIDVQMASNHTQFTIFNTECNKFVMIISELENSNRTLTEELQTLKANMAGHEERWRKDQEPHLASLGRQIQDLKTKLENQEREEQEKERVKNLEIAMLKTTLEMGQRAAEQYASQARTADGFLKKRTEEREKYRKEKEEMKEKLQEVEWKLERTATELENSRKERKRLEEEMEGMRMEDVSTPEIIYERRKINRKVSSDDDCQIIGESSGVPPKKVPKLVLKLKKPTKVIEIKPLAVKNESEPVNVSTSVVV